MANIVVDTLGSDAGYKPIVNGVIRALKELTDLKVYLVGRSEEIKPIIQGIDNIVLIDANEEITNYDSPIHVIKEKNNSSLVKAYDFIKENNDINIMISAGSSGAILTGAVMKLERINKCRPGLMALLPNEKGRLFALMDCGMNVECKAEHLLGFAKMASIYMKSIYNIENPRVAIVSNGSEEGKGNQLVKDTTVLLKESGINFVGNIEGTKVLSDEFDVLLTDGFTGNVLLKNIEGTAKTIIKEMYKQMAQSNEAEQKVIKNIINNLMKKYDFNSGGGAILLGVNKIIIKCHGSANEDTFYNALKQGYELAKNNVIEEIEKNL